MRRLCNRLRVIETEVRHQQPDLHFISVLQPPWDLDHDAREAWIAEQLTCDSSLTCPGKRVGAILPEKGLSVEAWAERAQAYYAQSGNRA
jgi:hypothetical protein